MCGQNLLAAECEQLSGQSHRSFPGALDLRRVCPQGIIRDKLIEQQVAVPVDDREQVVEIVSHSGGQPSHCLHLLCLAELVLQTLALCDVAKVPDSAIELPAGTLQGRGIPVKNPPVFEPNFITRSLSLVRVEIIYPFLKSRTILDLNQCVFNHPPVILGANCVLGDVPHSCKLLIDQKDLTGQTND